MGGELHVMHKLREAVLHEACALPADATLVAVAISQHFDRDGEAYPGYEYLRRITEAYVEGKAVDQDPNEWKPREIGRLLADLHGQLRTDGIPWNLKQFVLLIETKIRRTFTLYSDEPFTAELLAVPAELFLDGVAAVSSEGAEFADGRREQ